MKNLAKKCNGITLLLLCFFAFGIMPAMAQLTRAPRTLHSTQYVPVRSLTSEAIVAYECEDISGFSLGDPATLTSWGLPSPDGYIVAADYIDDAYYISLYPNGTIARIDPTTHVYSTVVASSNAQTIAYNPMDGKVYGYSIDEKTLYLVDLNSGTTTFVTTINTSNILLDFTITNDGRFLFIDQDDDAICELNPVTGDLSVLITANFDVSYIQDIGMDRETNTPYWAAFNADDETAPLYAIDLMNSTLSLIGEFATEVAGIATRTLAPADAARAAAPTDFTVTPDPDHGLSAELSWTNPTVDRGGNALTALTSVELYRDSVLLQSFANPTVGGAMTFTDNTVPANGLYTYKVYGVTDNGNGATATETAAIGHICNLIIDMHDSWGDGWNGASIEIFDTAHNSIGTYTCASANETVNAPVPVGTYEFYWNAGSYDSECSFTITNSFGIELYASSGTPTAGMFLTYNNTCTPPSYYTISGTVTSSVTNDPIADATVTFSGLNGETVTTDANGFYSKDSIVEAFPYTITVNATGFNTATESINSIFADTTIDFSLNAPAMEISYVGPIDVTTTQGLNTQYSAITVTNNGNGTLTWNTGVEFVRGRNAANEPINYTIEQTPRTEVNTTSDNCPTTGRIVGEPTRDAWDLLSSFEGTSAGQQGIATDGQYIYTCSWQGTPTGGYTFYKYDLEGNFLEGFDIPGATGLRDLTYDGTYFYAGASSNILYQLDFDNHMLVSSINTNASAIRHCSYDPEADGFWVGDWTDLYLIDRNGNIVTTGPVVSDVYGSAYDGYSAGGPYLWLFTQTEGNVGSAVFAQYDITNNVMTNTTFDVSTSQNALTSDAIAGGAFSTDALVGGKFVIMANVQQQPNIISVFEIADAGWLSASPHSGTLAPGQSVDIILDFDGNNPIGDYNANLTISTANPYVGDSIIPIVFHIVAPECDAPTNLQVVQTDLTYMALSWDAPEDVTDLVEYRIYKNGNLAHYQTTTETTYNDTVSPGEYCYFVKAYYSTDSTECLSLASDTVCAEMPVSVAEHQNAHAISVYPNPTSTVLNVNAEGFEQYQLVNMLGQVVKSDKLENGQTQINVSNLSNGIYFVRLNNGRDVETVKIIKK